MQHPAQGPLKRCLLCQNEGRPARQVGGRVRWMCYEKQVCAVLLDANAAGVVETLVRTTARNPCLNGDAAMLAQVRAACRAAGPEHAMLMTRSACTQPDGHRAWVCACL